MKAIIRQVTTWMSGGDTAGFEGIGKSCTWFLPRAPAADRRRIANPTFAVFPVEDLR